MATVGERDIVTRSEIAVVIRCHNAGRTLAAVLDSLAAQAHPPDELVVVDHGSDDPYTQQALARLAAGGHRVLREGGSAAAALNRGISATAAPYFVLLDADVTLSPTYLAAAAAWLDAHPEVAFVAPNGVGALDVEHCIAGQPPSSVSMIRRDVWVDAGGFDAACGDAHMLDFWLTLWERGSSGASPAEPLCIARIQRWMPSDPEARAHSLSQVYRKHEAALRPAAETILLANERHLISQKANYGILEDRRHALQLELATVQREIDETLRELEPFGHQRVNLGDLRRLSPISPVWGLDRGQPLDRYYIEAFLERHRLDIRGRVLEVKDAGYTRRFGEDRVAVADVVDIDATNPQATIVADLTQADHLAADTYDCCILTQALGVIYDARAALATAYRLLKRGGVLLCTLPAAGRISYEGPGLDGDFWRFTEASTRRLFAEVMPIDAFDVTGFGNVLACTAFLYGLAPHELSREELDHVDPFFPVVYGVRAMKTHSRD
jgi:SAM-dependent methyltransferase